MCEGKVKRAYVRLLCRGLNRSKLIWQSLGKTVQVAESRGLGLPGGIKLTPLAVIWTEVTWPLQASASSCVKSARRGPGLCPEAEVRECAKLESVFLPSGALLPWSVWVMTAFSAPPLSLSLQGSVAKLPPPPFFSCFREVSWNLLKGKGLRKRSWQNGHEWFPLAEETVAGLWPVWKGQRAGASVTFGGWCSLPLWKRWY